MTLIHSIYTMKSIALILLPIFLFASSALLASSTFLPRHFIPRHSDGIHTQFSSKSIIKGAYYHHGHGGSHHHHHHHGGDGDNIKVIETKSTNFPPIGGDQIQKPQVERGSHGGGDGDNIKVIETKSTNFPPIGGDQIQKPQVERGSHVNKVEDKSKIHVPILLNGEPQPDVEFNYLGKWEVQNENVGVSAMQMQLMPNNKAVWFDTTTLGPSAMKLDRVDSNNCPVSFETGEKDCYAHAIAYNFDNGTVRTLKIEGDPWCSSGGLGPNGDLIGTGGNKKGMRTVRFISPCDDCVFKEKHNALGVGRWYSTQQILEDGSIIVVGGRKEFSYDFMPPSLDFKPKVFDLPLLKETTERTIHTDRKPYENNLYPFVYLAPDGNVFLFANNRSILFNPYNGKTIREYPPLSGGARNYPPSGMSAILPFKLSKDNPNNVEAEVIVCGGNNAYAFGKVDKKPTKEKVFEPALQDCWRIKINDPKAQWVREQDLPHRRTMADLLHLPTGDLLFINGAQSGTAGWEDAEEPNLTPVLYRPYKPMGQRFMKLNPTTIPRMYHSSSTLLPRGNILVAGSNPHHHYTFTGAYPTDMRVELFWPPYTDPAVEKKLGTKINEQVSTKKFKYGGKFTVSFDFTAKSGVEFAVGEIKVTMIAPPFVTHGFSQNQRMLILALEDVKVSADEKAKGVTVTALAPASGKIAPPGYYMLFVVYRGVPSPGFWVHIS